MKFFAFIVLCLSILFFMILPGIEEYNKLKNGTKKERLIHSLIPSLGYVGLALAGFILFEIIPRICGQVIDSLFF